MSPGGHLSAACGAMEYLCFGRLRYRLNPTLTCLGASPHFAFFGGYKVVSPVLGEPIRVDAYRRRYIAKLEVLGVIGGENTGLISEIFYQGAPKSIPIFAPFFRHSMSRFAIVNRTPEKVARMDRRVLIRSTIGPPSFSPSPHRFVYQAPSSPHPRAISVLKSSQNVSYRNRFRHLKFFCTVIST
jgi:hypothetical protein